MKLCGIMGVVVFTINTIANENQSDGTQAEMFMDDVMYESFIDYY